MPPISTSGRSLPTEMSRIRNVFMRATYTHGCRGASLAQAMDRASNGHRKIARTPMIELHHVGTPNGHKVTIMLEETGLAYRVVPYNLMNGDHFTPEFRKINPNNKLPAIVDTAPADGGAPYAVFETGAILIYLAEKSGKLLPTELRRRHLALQWLMWQMASLGPMHGQAHHFIRYAPDGQAYGVERYGKEARRLMHVLEYRLREAPYLAEEYSIADIACWPWVRAMQMIDI